MMFDVAMSFYTGEVKNQIKLYSPKNIWRENNITVLVKTDIF